MAETVTFRPNVDKQDDFQQILDWCTANEYTFNSVVNSLLPAIAYTLVSNTVEVEGVMYMRCDFGDIPLQVPGPYIRRH